MSSKNIYIKNYITIFYNNKKSERIKKLSKKGLILNYHSCKGPKNIFAKLKSKQKEFAIYCQVYKRCLLISI